MLQRLAIGHGLPRGITTDNGTEFTSRAVDEWAHRYGVKLHSSHLIPEANRETVHRLAVMIENAPTAKRI